MRKTAVPIVLAAWVTAAMALSVAGLWVVRHLAAMEWFRANNEVAGNYLQTLGTIYAVLLAFVVFVVWQQHNETRDAVEKEANELADLYRILQSFESGGCDHLIELARAYQAAVIGEEWNDMARGKASLRAEQSFEELWAGLGRIEPRTLREETLYNEALARFNDLGDARSHRLFCSRLRLPPSLWGLLVVSGGLTVGSMGLFGMESFTAHAIMTAALSGSIAFILYLVADLDNPFWGDWQISADPFRHALSRGKPKSAPTPGASGADGASPLS